MFNTPVTIPFLPSSPAPRAIMGRLGAAAVPAVKEDMEKNFRNDWFREAIACCSFKGVWMIMPADQIPFSGELTGRILSGCSWAVLMAVTAGGDISQHVQKLFASGRGAEAAFADAVASEGVEDALNYMQRSLISALHRSGLAMKRARISPGYGDFSLSCQKDILELLEAGERLGISVNDVHFMTPEKSTTALTGAFEAVSPTTTGGIYDS